MEISGISIGGILMDARSASSVSHGYRLTFSNRNPLYIMSYRQIHTAVKIPSELVCNKMIKDVDSIMERNDMETEECKSKTIMAKGQGAPAVQPSKIPSTFGAGSIKPQKMYTEYATNESPKPQNQSKMRQITPSYETQKWFPSMEGKSEGKISAKELQTAFKTFQGKHFSDNVCKFVVRLFDLDKNGGIDIREFELLYSSVKKWVTAFNTCDRSRSGVLAESELDLALKQMEINFSPDFVTFLINRCDPVNKKMSLDQFIVTCVQMQKYTEEFRARDEKSDGIIKLKYEDFLELLMKTA